MHLLNKLSLLVSFHGLSSIYPVTCQWKYLINICYFELEAIESPSLNKNKREEQRRDDQSMPGQGQSYNCAQACLGFTQWEHRNDHTSFTDRATFLKMTTEGKTSALQTSQVCTVSSVGKLATEQHLIIWSEAQSEGCFRAREVKTKIIYKCCAKCKAVMFLALRVNPDLESLVERRPQSPQTSPSYMPAPGNHQPGLATLQQ